MKLAAFAVGLALFLLMLTPVAGNFNTHRFGRTVMQADGGMPPPPIHKPPKPQLEQT